MALAFRPNVQQDDPTFSYSTVAVLLNLKGEITGTPQELLSKELWTIFGQLFLLRCIFVT